MKYFLTNDDGIDAEGIQVLEKNLSGEIYVIAPDRHQSGCSHQVTSGVAFSYQQRDTNHFAVSGTPADCVRIYPYLVDMKPDWLVSGINLGGNLGVDIYMSGTVAAAREAAISGQNAIAISQYVHKDQPIEWNITGQYTQIVLTELMHRDLPANHFWNVNLPYITEDQQEIAKIIYCPPSTDPLDIAYRIEEGKVQYCGNYQQRPIQTGTDVDVCFSGNIAVSCIKI